MDSTPNLSQKTSVVLLYSSRSRSRSTVQGSSKEAVLKKPITEVNPEILKLQKIVENSCNDKSMKIPLWTSIRRKKLSEVSHRIFVACGISSIILFPITFLWIINLSNVHNVYIINGTSNKSNVSETTEVRTPFIGDIKNGKGAFVEYLRGVLCLGIGSIVVNIGRRRPYKRRSWWYLGAIFIFLASIAFIVAAPLLPLLASNTETEFHLRLFFHSGSYTQGKDMISQKQLKFFCVMIFRLKGFFYFMWFTAVIPFLAFVFCWVEVIVNTKRWHTLTLQHYKVVEKSNTDNNRNQISRAGSTQVEEAPELEDMY